ncbi:MAG: hypothetical protein UZ22_OP11002000057 [Microgenomates bacterium OLB23]|nr:MAG: hypothetical protein UZ22_OP11002000057 [Microgenomates bacterium OLB23]
MSFFKLDVAFIVTVIFVSMRWYFSFARFSFEATFLLMLELIALYAMLVFRKTQAIVPLIIAAIGAGLAYNSYTPGRIFVLLMLSIILLSSKRKLLHFTVFGVVYAALIAPLSLYFVQHNDIRIQQQLYLQNTELTLTEKAQFFAENVWKNIRMLFGQGDVNGRHNYPYKSALNPVLNLFLALGIMSMLKSRKIFYHALFSMYLLLGLLPTLLTYPHENPNMLRTYTMLPALAYFMGLGILWIYGQVKKDEKKSRLVTWFVLFMLLISVVYEVRSYFVFQKLVYIQAFDLMNVFENLPK